MSNKNQNETQENIDIESPDDNGSKVYSQINKGANSLFDSILSVIGAIFKFIPTLLYIMLKAAVGIAVSLVLFLFMDNRNRY